MKGYLHVKLFKHILCYVLDPCFAEECKDCVARPDGTTTCGEYHCREGKGDGGAEGERRGRDGKGRGEERGGGEGK